MERIGKYEILGQIGAGGFGVVYKGRDPFIDRPVAVKTCSSDDEELRHRFVREARTAGRLQHRNITTVYDFGYHEGTPYLVQEYLTGEDLDKIIKRGERPPMATRLAWLEQIARGLAYAHANGIVHRDVKPANIRTLEDGTVKIMDFGIAKLLGNDSGLTRVGATVGTAAYLAPEQLHGDPVDARTDLFAFGVVAYELLAGHRPFAGKQLSAVIFQILHHEPVALGDVSPDTPPAVAALVARCLAKDRAMRPRSGDEVADELAAALTALTSGVEATARTTYLPAPPPVAPRPPPSVTETAPIATVPPAPSSVESTSGIRDLHLDPDAMVDPSSGSLSGSQTLRERSVPWQPVALGVGALALVVLLAVAIPRMLREDPVAAATPDGPAIEEGNGSEGQGGEGRAIEDPSDAPGQGQAATTSEPGAGGMSSAASIAGQSVGTETTTAKPGTPAEPPPPATATLVVSASWASNGSLEVAGRRLSLDRSHELELPPGSYRLEFSLREPYSSRATVPIELGPGDRRAVAPPFGRPGLLTLQPRLGTPAGRITVDGQPRGAGIIRQLVLAPGRHQVQIVATGGGGSVIDHPVTLQSGRELVMTFDLGSSQVTEVVRDSP